jgi:hypothetical protein
LDLDLTLQVSVFGIVVAVMVVIWKKSYFIKNTFSWGWFEKIYV